MVMCRVSGDLGSVQVDIVWYLTRYLSTVKHRGKRRGYWIAGKMALLLGTPDVHNRGDRI